MTQVTSSALSVCAAPGSGTEPVQTLTGRLVAAGFGVHTTRWHDRHELTILNLTAARASFTLTSDGHARWGYEPATGAGISPAALAAITRRQPQGRVHPRPPAEGGGVAAA
jgi:hypothetical protein